MKINKFTAASMPEAMRLVRAELGNDAVILNSRVIETGGFLGFFRKKNFEVIAAVDPATKQDSRPVIKEKKKAPQGPSVKETPGKTDFSRLFANPEAAAPNVPDDLLKELSEIKKLIKTERSGNDASKGSYPEQIMDIQQLMEEQEFSHQLQEHFLGLLLEKWYMRGQKSDSKEITSWFREDLQAFLSDTDFGGLSFTKKFINVVGPTGVGKTTTLAKIAADCVIKYKKKVAFITTDTYRIGAIEQLKTYAKILNVPLEVCYNIDDFKEASQKFEDYDIVLIDTAGRNFRNKQYVEDLQKIIDFNKDMETFLVLSLTAKQKDMEQIYRQFSIVNINKLIFTKADETSVYGPMINMIKDHQIGVSYVTNGQNVPDDMTSANPEVLINLLLGVE